MEWGNVRQKRVPGNKIAFWRESKKIIQIIGVLSEEEIKLSQIDASLLDEEQIVRIEKVMEELRKDVTKGCSNFQEW